MRKWLTVAGLLAVIGLFSQCSVSKQVKEAKAFGDCKYRIAAVDSIYLAGTDVREFRNIRSIRDFDPTKYPHLGLAFLRKNIPLDLRVNLDITNPTKTLAAINQLEYKVLLADSELFSGFLNRRIEVYPGTGSTRVPISLSANAYELLADDKTRDEFLAMVQALSGKADMKPTKLTIKVKPTLSLGDKQVNYPGYITFQEEITREMLLGASRY